MQWITAQRLQREFALPKVLAREIVAEQWQAAVRTRWQPWVWLACWMMPVLAGWFGWLPWNPDVHQYDVAVWLMIGATGGWAGIGHWMAGPAMLTAAAVRARRLQRDGADWAPQANATSTTASHSAPSTETLRP